jgi:hypothetical protein
MNMGRSVMRAWNIMVASAIVSLSVAPSTARSEYDLQSAHVVVSGEERLVYAFHKLLKEGVASEFDIDFGAESTPVSCTFIRNAVRDCSELAETEGTDTLRLEYMTFRDRRHITLFLDAWTRLVDMRSAHDEPTNLTVTFDARMPAGDCNDADFAKQPCVNAPQCPYTKPRRCDRVSGAPCSSCGVP